MNDHQLGSKQAMFFLEDMSHQQDRFIVPSRDPRTTLSIPGIPTLVSDKPIKASKSKWKIIPFGQNDHTTDMFHPKKIPQRLMRKYANWEQTPGGILVSVPCQTIIYSLIHWTCDPSATVDQRAEPVLCPLIWTVFIKTPFRTNWHNFWDGKSNTTVLTHELLDAQDLRLVSNF